MGLVIRVSHAPLLGGQTAAEFHWQRRVTSFKLPAQCWTQCRRLAQVLLTCTAQVCGAKLRSVGIVETPACSMGFPQGSCSRLIWTFNQCHYLEQQSQLYCL